MLRPSVAHGLACVFAAFLAPACSDGAGADDPVPSSSSSEGSGSSSTASASDDSGSSSTDAASDGAAPSCPAAIEDALAGIEGLAFTEQPSGDEGRLFAITFDQPADHGAPEGVRFEQRMLLHHVSFTAPMVLATTGYDLRPATYVSELKGLLSANQLQVEQRFFGGSRPEPADWGLLTIEQAAADHHRIVEALRPCYVGPWVSTGVSKGGMASIYHRRFYPDDIDATVAYSAPHMLDGPDTRFVEFMDTVGAPSCRAALQAAQREILLRREAMEARLTAMGAATFERLGPAQALEFAATELGFAFWAYRSLDTCARVPTSDTSDGSLFAFLTAHLPIEWVSDAGIESLTPYYYQSTTELGFPAYDERHLADLLQFPGADVPAAYLPENLRKPHDPAVMADITAWVASDEAETTMFVYGQYDPWSAAPFAPQDPSHVFVVPQGNHDSVLVDLPGPERSRAFELLSGWLGHAKIDDTVPRSAAPEPMPRFPL